MTTCPDIRPADSPAMVRALTAIAALRQPVDPVTAKVRLARKCWREAWKLRAGLPVGDGAGGSAIAHPDVADKWAPQLRVKALALMLEARGMRFDAARDAKRNRAAGAALDRTLAALKVPA